MDSTEQIIDQLKQEQQTFWKRLHTLARENHKDISKAAAYLSVIQPATECLSFYKDNTPPEGWLKTKHTCSEETPLEG